MKHTFQCHSSTPTFSYTCGISGCIQTFKTYSGFTTHLSRKHSDWESQSVNTTTSHQELGTPEDENEPDEPQEEPVSGGDGGGLSTDLLIAKRSSALLLLTLKERYRLSQSAVNFAVGQIKQITAHILDDVKASVKQRIDDVSSINSDDVNIDDCFDIDPFEGLGTEHLQTKFYCEQFNLVVSYLTVATIFQWQLNLS